MLKMSRLPGRSVKGFGWSFQRHQLWLGSEYLLFREISGYREEVKRFYYGDIQAIVWGPTGSWRNCSIASGIILVLAAILLVFLAIAGAPDGLLFSGCLLAGISAAILMVNLILGPTCKTVLYTATSEAPLYSLGRQRAAEKAIARIIPLVDGAQQGIAPPPPAESAPSPPEPMAEPGGEA